MNVSARHRYAVQEDYPEQQNQKINKGRCLKSSARRHRNWPGRCEMGQQEPGGIGFQRQQDTGGAQT